MNQWGNFIRADGSAAAPRAQRAAPDINRAPAHETATLPLSDPVSFLRGWDRARGQATDVFALSLDMRGFSAFCVANEGDVVTKLLHAVLSQCARRLCHAMPVLCVKSTGDGLMIVYGTAIAEELRHLVRSDANVALELVSLSQRLVSEFSLICRSSGISVDRCRDMPTGLGIGIAAGSAMAIVSEADSVLDFVGRPLNVSARLSQRARPYGVLVSQEILHSPAIEKLNGRLSNQPDLQFTSGRIAMRGAAEEGHRIWITNSVAL
jgi:class 3 adenylate cyclase